MPGIRAREIYIRVNALDTDMTLGDLAAVMPGRPDGIVLPKCAGAADVNRLSLYLDAFEAAAGIEHGATRIVTVATETARAVLEAARLRKHEPAAVGHDVGRRGSRGLARRVAQPDGEAASTVRSCWRAISA